MNQECVDILLKVMAAGSVREEFSSPQMPPRCSRGKLVAVWPFVWIFLPLGEENGSRHKRLSFPKCKSTF